MSIPVYKGIYLLAERVKRDSNRIDIIKLDNSTNALPGVSGGYIMFVDKPGVNDIVVMKLDYNSWHDSWRVMEIDRWLSILPRSPRLPKRTT